ncbi:MraY family glycosyltransferase [Tepidibacillus decaturensis]|uniref:UDP-phosphate N-acetylgalactosaminyl-1-phosphate transferase n=1 Tax=Tepidibacillus decaturensis TaxID=1413211 RepID=A0A135L0W1_9BACI|nr:MraY family glycosyltransferase [Tepidibacillus decaturensis]KXG42641.1 hypothetical protein U473_00205 [Tepidibacillus decaturensis]
MKSYLLPFIFAFFSVLILVPILRIIAFRYHFVDIPNQRKIHREPIPLLGGIAIFIGYILSSWIWIKPLNLRLAIFIAGLLIVGIGLLDDYYKTRNKDLSAFPKFLIHFLIGLLLFALDIRIEGITSPLQDQFIPFPPGLSLFVTLLWVIGLMNMMNFLDGADGLASGITLISSMTLFLIAFVKGQEVTPLLSAILMGSSLGFLRHNFYPAKIFMGDAGSAFLGMVLAIISIEGALKSATLISIVMVILALGVPIFDTILVLFKRIRQSKPLYIADQNHAHHRLIRMGYTQKQAVTLIYVIGILFSMIAILVLYLYYQKV